MNHKPGVIASLVFSCTVRIVVALYLGDIPAAPPLLTDQVSYHALAVRLTEGHGFSFDRGWYPFTPADTPTAHWSYLYSLFLAGIYAVFGPHPLGARLVQAVLAGILVPWGVYRLAGRLFPERARLPVLALAAAAVYSYFALYSATLMTESLFIICLLWSLCAVTDGEDALVADEAPAFAEAVLRLLREPGLRQRLRENGHRLAQTAYNWELRYAEWDRVYGEVLAG